MGRPITSTRRTPHALRGAHPIRQAAVSVGAARRTLSSEPAASRARDGDPRSRARSLSGVTPGTPDHLASASRARRCAHGKQARARTTKSSRRAAPPRSARCTAEEHGRFSAAASRSRSWPVRGTRPRSCAGGARRSIGGRHGCYRSCATCSARITARRWIVRASWRRSSRWRWSALRGRRFCPTRPACAAGSHPNRRWGAAAGSSRTCRRCTPSPSSWDSATATSPGCLIRDAELLGDLSDALALGQHPIRLAQLADDLLGCSGVCLMRFIVIVLLAHLARRIGLTSTGPYHRGHASTAVEDSCVVCER